MTPLSVILDAAAGHLASLSLIYWDPAGAYPATPPHPPAYAKRFPAGAPDTAVILTVYALELSPDPNDPLQRFRLQVRCRAPADADPLADSILTALHPTHRQVWGGVHIHRCRHLSTAQLGADQVGRDERSDNYELEIT